MEKKMEADRGCKHTGGGQRVNKSRAERAGELLGKAIIEMVHLMYQKNTALNFLDGLLKTLTIEYAKRDSDYRKRRKKK